MIHTDTPNLGAPQQKPFKLKLSLPGKNIGGEWLCRLGSDVALAYQDFCATHGSERRFRPYVHDDGKTYLQDQDGNWLSYESASQCLKMRYWTNAVAWKIESHRLIREQDGAVLSWRDKQSWPLATEHYFLTAERESGNALTVERVEVEG